MNRLVLQQYSDIILIDFDVYISSSQLLAVSSLSDVKMLKLFNVRELFQEFLKILI